MINLNKNCLFYIKENTNLIDAIKIIKFFSYVHNEDAKLVFKQYYKSLNKESDLYYLDNYEDKVKVYQIHSSIMSFIGPRGILPCHYSEKVVLDLKNKDTSLLDFLNIFYDAIQNVFVKIVTDYNVLEYFKYSLFRCSGVSEIGGFCSLLDKDLTHNVIVNASLFTIITNPVSMLKRLVSNLFNVKVEIKEFVKEYVDLNKSDLSKLGMIRLGCDFVLGGRVCIVQNKIKIVLKDLSLQKHIFIQNIVKDRKHFFHRLLRFWLGYSINYKIVAQPRKPQIKKTILSTQKPLMLGRNFWCFC